MEEWTMRDTELYQNLLGIMSPWSVESVMTDVEKQRVDVTVSHPPNLLFACPECGTESPVFFGKRVSRPGEPFGSGIGWGEDPGRR